MSTTAVPAASYAPVHCPECRAYGPAKLSCLWCHGRVYACLSCGERVHPPEQYRLPWHCSCYINPYLRREFA